MRKMCLLLLWKVKEDKNDVFLFFINVKYLTLLTFAQEAHALLKEPRQNNRRLTEQ